MPVPAGLDPATVLAVHPTQLYEAVIMLAAFALLWRLRLSNRPTGWVFGVYLMFAGAERFLVEILRAKDDRFFGPLTVAQVTSIVLVLSGTADAGAAAERRRPGPGFLPQSVGSLGTAHCSATRNSLPEHSSCSGNFFLYRIGSLTPNVHMQQ